LPLLLDAHGSPPVLAEATQQANHIVQPPAPEVTPKGHIFLGCTSLDFSMNERIGVSVFRRLSIAATFVALVPLSLIAEQTSLRTGTPLAIRVDQAVSGETIQVGAEVSASLSADLVQDNHTIFPAGTPVVLRISQVSRKGDGNSLPQISLRAIAFVIHSTDGPIRVPILTNESMRIGAPIELKAVTKAAHLLIGRHDKFKTSAPADERSGNYQDAKFVPGDTFQLSLTEEAHLP
jgi:hypothetical protein